MQSPFIDSRGKIAAAVGGLLAILAGGCFSNRGTEGLSGDAADAVISDDYGGPFKSSVCQVTPPEPPFAATERLAVVAHPDGSVDQYFGTIPISLTDHINGPSRVYGGFGPAVPSKQIGGAVVLSADVPATVRSSDSRSLFTAQMIVGIQKDGALAIASETVGGPPARVFTAAEVKSALGEAVIAIQDGKFVLNDGKTRDGVIEQLLYPEEKQILVARRAFITSLATPAASFVPDVGQRYLFYLQNKETVPVTCITRVTRGYIMTQTGNVHQWFEPTHQVDTKVTISGVRDIAATFADSASLIGAGSIEDGFERTAVVVAKKDGTAWFWNVKRSRSNGTVEANDTPRQILGLAGIKKVAIGRVAAFFLDEQGRIWEWRVAELTNDARTTVVQNKPGLVEGLNNIQYMVIAMNGSALLAQRSDGKILMYQHGAREHFEGNKGNPQELTRLVPSQMGWNSQTAELTTVASSDHLDF